MVHLISNPGIYTPNKLNSLVYSLNLNMMSNLFLPQNCNFITLFQKNKIKCTNFVSHQGCSHLVILFTAILTPKPFKMVGSTVLNDRPCRLHSLCLNKGCKWLSHLKWRIQLSAILTLFLAITLLTIELLFVFCGIQV